LVLPVGGAFHSPLMEPARVELEAAIKVTKFNSPICPVYQNVTASAVINPEEIQKNLIAQLTAPVKWTQTIKQMIADGATSFTEVGPGKVLQGLVKKVNPAMEAASI
jgi:[acyl-carrier-protein] S-malonyltransferase